jgi:hypothetical protein
MYNIGLLVKIENDIQNESADDKHGCGFSYIVTI